MVSIVIAIAVGIAASRIAMMILGDEPDSPFVDSKPTTLARRGAYVDYIMGRRRSGVSFLASLDPVPVGDNNFRGRAWHGLCLGPQKWGRSRLVRVRVDNKDLYSALNGGSDFQHNGLNWKTYPIANSETIVWHPGTYESTPNPELNTLASETDSTFPYLATVLYKNKFLEYQPQWPLVDYEVRIELPTRDQYIEDGKIGLTQSTPNMMSVKDLDDTATAHGISRVDFTTTTGATSPFPSEVIVQIYLNGLFASQYSDGDTVRLTHPSEPDLDGLGCDIHSITNISGETRLTCTTNLVFNFASTFGNTISTPGGTCQKCIPGSDGVNPAHAVLQLLFAKYPHGLDESQEDFDMNSLEECGVVFQNEHLALNVQARNGEKLQAILGTIMQDAGMFITLRDDKWQFRVLREESSVITIPKGALGRKLPEISKKHGTKETNKVVFQFRDRALNYKEQTINVDDDGNASLAEYARQDTVQMRNVTDLSVAGQVSNRRSREQELDEAAGIQVELQREAFDLTPGDVVRLPDDVKKGRFRVMETQPRQLSSVTRVGLKRDVFAFQQSGVQFLKSTAEYIAPDVPDDPHSKIWELPLILRDELGRFGVLVSRGSDRVERTDLWVSSTQSGYYHKGTIKNFAVGGELQSELPRRSKRTQILSEVIFKTISPDTNFPSVIDQVREWRTGRLMMLIEEELFYIQDIARIGNDLWSAKRLIRARLGTEPRPHLEGAEVFVFTKNQIFPIQDPVLTPRNSTYFKTVPRTRQRALNVATALERQHFTEGYQEQPSRVINLRGDYRYGYSNAFKSTDDFTFKWSYLQRNNIRTGAGLLDADGSPIRKQAPEERFTLVTRFGSTIGRTVTDLTTNEYAYSNANLVSDFGTVPAYFHVDVYSQYGAFTSPTESIKLTLIS